MTALEDTRCESCGRRGVALVGIDFRDGSQIFVLCVRCASDAVDNGCTQVALSEVDAS